MLSHRLRRFGLCLLAATACSLPACSSDGHFTMFGYTTAPNYDRSIKTIFVPICKNKTMRRGLEFDVTRAIIREIMGKTPYRVVDSPVGADTELVCTIISRPKAIVNASQEGEIRESQVTLAVEVIWRDLRPGHTGNVLSNGASGQVPSSGSSGSNLAQPDKGKTQGIILTPTTTFVPELGGSITTAELELANRLAVQIVSMMEVWGK